ncbi:MAG TPA: hypothetical protein DEP20_00185 [Fusobacteria bacterium]|nr:hypothetical protein [Fusobacteriota bacterium]|tara:strand:+ start:6097 stop:6312 length:216 start_codon:yes stop_codon:yes gene_type:complete
MSKKLDLSRVAGGYFREVKDENGNTRNIWGLRFNPDGTMNKEDEKEWEAMQNGYGNGKSFDMETINQQLEK